MLQTWGLTKAGFKQKDLSSIKDDLESALRREVDPTLHFGSGTITGVLTGIVANQAAQVWEALSGLCNSLKPDSATGRALDALCSLTGTYRYRASYSRVKALVKLAAHTSLPKGSRIKTGNGHFFKTTSTITNNSPEDASIEADFIAEDTGPKIALSDSAVTIMTPVSGWYSVSILDTYEEGRVDETDDELRIRRIRNLRALGSSTIDSMRSRLGELHGVEAIFIKEGEQSFEVVIKGGNDLEIAQTIWACKPLGVKSVGSLVQTIHDSIKQERLVRFSRPSLKDLTLHANIKVKQKIEENALKNLLAEFARHHFSLGTEIYPSRFFTALLAHSEVLDVLTLQLRERSSGNIIGSEIKENEIASLGFKDIYIEQILETLS